MAGATAADTGLKCMTCWLNPAPASHSAMGSKALGCSYAHTMLRRVLQHDSQHDTLQAGTQMPRHAFLSEAMRCNTSPSTSNRNGVNNVSGQLQAVGVVCTLIWSSYVLLRSCWLQTRSCTSRSLACILACVHTRQLPKPAAVTPVRT